MMTSLAQAYSPHPGGMQPHPGVPQGHAMAVPHNPGQQGQPGMPQQMHMGVSGPGGPQVSQAGAMMGGMPPGAGGPSQHALQHLNPNAAAQQQMLQQQQAMAFASNPQFQMQQQQHMIQQQQRAQVARQAMMAQSYSGMPVMQNGIPQMTPAQFNAMRGTAMARPVNLPQHLQQAQQQAQHSLEQQQAQAQAQHQHQQQQQMMAQQMAMQQQQQQANAQAQGGNQGQHNQLNPQQLQNMQQQAQIAQAQQAHQQQSAAAAQQNQPPQSQPQQPQPQQSQPNQQAQAQQPQQQNQPQQQGITPQAAAAAMMQRQQQGERLRGQCLMRLMQFAEHLSGFAVSSRPLLAYMANGTQRLAAQGSKQKDDLNYWLQFVEKFFSPKGVLRHSVWIVDETSNKQYEITFPALARYFHTHFESGIKTMQLIMEKGTEKDLPNNGHYIESPKSSFVYWFDTGSQLVANGTLRAHFDADQKIELLEFVTSSHEEYIPRTKIIEAARPLHEWGKEWHKVNAPPEGKNSPEMNKKKAKALKSPPQPPPEIDLPTSKVKPSMGITPSVFRFLELAEVMGQMNPLFNYSHQHSSLAPYAALDQYVSTVATNGTNNPNGQQPNPSGPRTPGLGNFPLGASPAAAHLNLPGSPHVGGSPAQGAAMQLQQSQHGTSSSGPSANTSPNTSNKRRRPSAVKAEDEGQANGAQGKKGVNPSPRIQKRQKPNAPS